MRKYTRPAALLLVTLIAAGLIACGSEPSSEIPADHPETAAAETTAAETEPAYTPPIEDFGGTTFTILHPSERYYDIAEEQNGEIVNDAIYDRDSRISENYNIEFVHVQETDEWSKRQKYNDKIRGVVLAGDGAYDLVYGIEICTTETFTEGLYYNLLDFDEMLLDEIWWCPGQVDTFAIDGKLFGAFGLSTMDLYKEVSILFINMNIAGNYNLEIPLQAVIDGRWTAEMFMDMTKTAVNDVNGDGRFTLGTDLIGYIARSTNDRSWQTGLDIRTMKVNADGRYEIVPADEFTAAKIDLFKNFKNSNPGAIYIGDADNDIMNAFMADLGLFYCERLKTSEKMRGMESDYGVLPFPKYNEEQDHYYSQVATATTMVLFPLSVPDPHMSAVICEAMAYWGYEEILPVYYESALKNKYMREEINAEVLDIIFEHTFNDLSFAYAGTLGGSPQTHQVFQHSAFFDKEYASTYESNKKIWETNLAKLYEAYEALN